MTRVMTEETEIWECEYCGNTFYSEKGAIDHENTCRSNPNVTTVKVRVEYKRVDERTIDFPPDFVEENIKDYIKNEYIKSIYGDTELFSVEWEVVDE